MTNFTGDVCKGDIRLDSGCKACQKCYFQLEAFTRVALLEAEAALEVATAREHHPKPRGPFKSSETLGLEVVRYALANKPFEGAVSQGLHKLLNETAAIGHDLTTAMQAAWIEWEHGEGAESAMGWIHNTLVGPGHIPDEDEPWGTEPQAWFDANRSNPGPACECGRPGNILAAGKGYCSENCYRTAKNLPLLPQQPAQLGARVAMARDAERWRAAVGSVTGTYLMAYPAYVFGPMQLEFPENVLKGSVAEHFTKSIDAKIANEKAAQAKADAEEAARYE